MSLKREIGFVLNGIRTRATVPVEMSTLAMLREVIGLTGTKYACGEGECGRARSSSTASRRARASCSRWIARTAC